MLSLPQWVVLQQNKEAIFWGTTAGLIIHPTTRSIGFGMGKFGVRATANVTIASTRALFGTTLVRGGSMTLGSAVMVGTASVGLGYALGAVIGTGISQVVWGDEGAQDALYFYSHPVKATRELFS